MLTSRWTEFWVAKLLPFSPFPPAQRPTDLSYQRLLYLTELCYGIAAFPFALWASLLLRRPGNSKSLLRKEYIFELFKLPLVLVQIFLFTIVKIKFIKKKIL